MKMLRFFLLVSLMFSSVCLFGTLSTDRQVSDSIKIQIEYMKKVLNSDEWEPVDDKTNNKIEELVDYLENSPIDTIIAHLKNNTD
ncbi:MAG TPA: recombinase family protein, partial [Prolixibacteraceae bacterium]|nr:recombinase family protein [Prolixibacteraceae bacterium]